MLASNTHLQLLMVGSPNRHPLSPAPAAIEAGLDLVVDKPLALSSHEAAQIIEVGRWRGAR